MDESRSNPNGEQKRPRIALASQDRVEDYQYELEEILEVIGYPEALITDLSSLGDFFFRDPEAFDECSERMAGAFGIEVIGPNERLVDLAKRVREARKVM